jgi:hypothetical protein
MGFRKKGWRVSGDQGIVRISSEVKEERGGEDEADGNGKKGDLSKREEEVELEGG